MKEITVSAKVLAAAQKCQAKDDIRYYLNGVLITKDRIVGTNGHIMFFGENKQVEGSSDPGKDCIISLDKAVPRSAWFATLKMIDDKCGYVTYRNGRQKDVGRGMFSLVDGKFPEIDKIIAGTNAAPVPTESIGLNQQYVALSGSVFGAFRKQGQAEMKFFGKTSAVLVSARDPDCGLLSMIIMPCRI